MPGVPGGTSRPPRPVRPPRARSRPKRAATLVRTASLVLFLILLVLAALGLARDFPLDIHLRLDPAATLATILAARAVPVLLAPGLALLALTPLLGRFFCGWICPMGATIDASDALLAPRKKRPVMSARLRAAKHLFLLTLLAAAALGASWVFLGAPIPLVTRFYGLALLPGLNLLGKAGVDALRPLADDMGWNTLAFAEIKAHTFATWSFAAAFFVLVIGAARLSPRFWCRYLCPAGALLGLLSLRPLLRRRVSESCIECGKCQRSCPMRAIPGDPLRTLHAECIGCRSCEAVCPVDAISFPLTDSRETHKATPLPDLSRRQAIAGGAALAAGTALAFLPGAPRAESALRPPGSLPEESFLTRCIRCGECARVCPTNTLQPAWLETGLSGLFSPQVTPLVRFCDPHCRACGRVCPTGAIREIRDAGDRIWAKIGTAKIIRKRCLAWEKKKKCLVCDEVCPYDAVTLRPEPGNPVHVPYLDEKKCSGCGFCEHHCPVPAPKAIVVEPAGAVRIESGSLERAARKRGLGLTLKPPKEGAYAPGGPESYGQEGAPGFGPSGEDPDADGGLPPGFSK